MLVNEGVILVGQAASILALFSWLAGTVTTYVRGKVMESPNKEDGPVMNFFNFLFLVPNGKLKVLPGNDENDHAVNRWTRIGQNNTANIPISLFIFLIAAILQTIEVEALRWIIWIYVGSRFFHTLTYALSLQPFRTITYSVGCLCMFLAAISILAYS